MKRIYLRNVELLIQLHEKKNGGVSNKIPAVCIAIKKDINFVSYLPNYLFILQQRISHMSSEK